MHLFGPLPPPKGTLYILGHLQGLASWSWILQPGKVTYQDLEDVCYFVVTRRRWLLKTAFPVYLNHWGSFWEWLSVSVNVFCTHVIKTYPRSFFCITCRRPVTLGVCVLFSGNPCQCGISLFTTIPGCLSVSGQGRWQLFLLADCVWWHTLTVRTIRPCSKAWGDCWWA